MPIYEYRCPDCEQIFEEWQKDFEERQVPCPVCGNLSDRIMSNTTFVLKGTGWYVTDYAKKGASAPSNGNGNGSASKAESKDSGKAASPPSKGKEAPATGTDASK